MRGCGGERRGRFRKHTSSPHAVLISALPGMRRTLAVIRTYSLSVLGGVIIFSSHLLHSQPSFFLGGTAGYEYNIHKALFNIFPQGTACGEFQNGHGNGFYAGVTGEFPILTNLRASARGVFARMSGKLTARCTDNIIVPIPGTNEFAPLIRESRYEADLDYGMIELGMRYIPIGSLPIFIHAGVGIGAPVFNASFYQDEEILSPKGVLFENNVRKRPVDAGDFVNAQTRFAVNGGIGYEFRLRKNLSLLPEVSYAHSFSDVTTGRQWKVQNVRAGVSLLFGIGEHEEAPPQKEEPIIPKPEEPAPAVSIKTTEDASVHILETIVTETFPLLPYIFFEKNSAVLIDRYHHTSTKETFEFREQLLPRKTLDIYHNILDIFGKRLRDNPPITITLIGTTDNKDVELNNQSIAYERAATVKRYFIDVWKIDSGRIEIRTQHLPSIPTSPIYVEGDEENRRVEILSDSDELFRPVVHERFSEYSISPPTMKFDLGATSQNDFVFWQLTAKKGTVTLANFEGRGNLPGHFEWTLSDSVARTVDTQDRITCALTVVDMKGKTSTSGIDVPVFKSRNAHEVSRLSLIVFDFDKSEIVPQNQKMIRKFVAVSIQPRSSVVITGSTDKLGEADHNMQLSTDRAYAVRDILVKEKPSLAFLEAKGIGEAPDVYDNALPEGRYYCRTVAVQVKTPILDETNSIRHGEQIPNNK